MKKTALTALVIGAGIGGIATAARLAKNGYDVTVLEKESTPGGRCNQIVRDGHRFDIGATLLMMPAVYERTFTDFGKNLYEELDLVRMDPVYRLKYPGKRTSRSLSIISTTYPSDGMGS